MRTLTARVTARIAGFVCLLALTGMPAPAQDRDFSKVEITATKVAGNVYMLQGSGGNIGVSVGSDGLLIVDDQFAPLADKIHAALRGLSPASLKFVLNTHWHGDHTGGNAAFPAGVTFFAHPFSAPRIKQPTEAVADKKVLQLGGTEVQILFLGRAHTGGDLQVFLPKEKILYMSEVFINRIFPSMANGYPSDWVATLKKSEALDPIWYVPAHGFVDAAPVLKEEERNYRLAIEKIIAEGTRLHAAKTPAESAAAGARLEPYDGWTRAANNATSALQRIYLEIDGSLGGR
jgi:cyclase